jgi:hypothetical protein
VFSINHGSRSIYLRFAELLHLAEGYPFPREWKSEMMEHLCSLSSQSTTGRVRVNSFFVVKGLGIVGWLIVRKASERAGEASLSECLELGHNVTMNPSSRCLDVR